MNITRQLFRPWASTPTHLVVSYSRIASLFFSIGVLTIIAEALFFDYFQSLAHTAYSTRAVIGFHLFPSEIWFIFLGNGLVFLAIANNNFRLPRNIAPNVQPVLLIVGVYALWFVYGSMAGNSWALQEFREMAFSAFSLPAILYFAPLVSVRVVLRKFIMPTIMALIALSASYATNTALILGTFFVAFFALNLLYKNGWSVFGLALASLPFLIKFSKPMIVLYAFCMAASFLLAGYLNPRSTNWIFSRFKLKALVIGLTLVLALILLVAAIDAWTDGAIERIIRWYFLKQRVGPSGDIVYADISGGRLNIWRAALESWTNRPLFGYGLGAELEAYSRGWVVKTQFHSYLFQALHNTGFIGLCLITGAWFVWTARTLRNVYYVRDLDEKIILGSMLIYVMGIGFYGLYGHSLSHPPSTQFFWLCLGFLSALRRPLSPRVYS